MDVVKLIERLNTDKENEEYVIKLMKLQELTEHLVFSLDDLIDAALYLARQEERHKAIAAYKSTYTADYASGTTSAFDRLMRQADIVDGRSIHFTTYNEEDKHADM